MSKYIRWGILASVVVIVIWCIPFLLKTSHDCTWSDKYTAIGALFTGLAFVGFLITILVQQRQIELSAQQAQEQRLMFNIQSFDSKFFNLLNLHHEIVNALTTKIGYRNQVWDDVFGRDIFLRAVDIIYAERFTDYERKLTDDFIQVFKDIYGKEPDEPMPVAANLYIEFIFRNHKQIFSHYFRNLFNLIRFVDESLELLEIEKKNKEIRHQYVKLLRAQLSNYELLIIAYNGLTPFGKPFVKYILKYELLNPLDINDEKIVDLETLKNTYSI